MFSIEEEITNQNEDRLAGVGAPQRWWVWVYQGLRLPGSDLRAIGNYATAQRQSRQFGGVFGGI